MPDLLSGWSLEVAGNCHPRWMVTTRLERVQNSAYRSAWSNWLPLALGCDRIANESMQVARGLLLVVALTIVLMLSACTQTALAPTATPVPATSTPAPTPTVAIPTLTLDMLRNAEYQSEFPSSRKAQLKNGIYTESIAPGSASKLTVRLADQYAIADLNGDSIQDAAAILITNSGGSGTFFTLAVVINEKGTPKHVASASLGDRVKINSLSIQSGEIIVNMISHGPNDPLCCPSLEVTQRYKLQGDQLVKTT